jgi:hypothetical protein
MYIVWVLGRLEPGSLLLIEEPETFLSPRAQIALVDVIASYIKSKGFTVVMTSHSGPIAQRLQNSEIVYVTRASGQVVLHAPARTVDLVARLGLRSDRAFILFVEDVAGEIFARTLMNRYSDRLSGGVEYVRCNGESNVIRAIEAIPNDIRAVAHLGVLDGDQRAAKLDDPRILYLPSAVAPERLLRDFTATKTSDQLASYLGVSEADVSRALAHADGDELHNWPHTMSGSLNGMPHAEFMRRMFLAWSAENLGEVESFVRSVENFSAAT